MSLRRKAFSLPELLLVCGIFSGFLVASYLCLSTGLNVWERTENKRDAADQLQRAVGALKSDLLASSFAVCAVTRCLGLAEGGDVLWMLSALDQDSGDLMRYEGVPFWQRNFVYYLAIPRDHQAKHPRCSGEVSSCPHKVLLRKVVDSGSPTQADSLAAEMERLIEPKNICQQLLQPESSHSDADFFVAASGIAKFSVVKAPDPEWSDEIEVSITAVDEEQSRGMVVRRIVFSVFPDNEVRR